MYDFTVLVLSGAWTSSVSVSLDTLRAAAHLAPGLGLPVPRWRVVSPSGGVVALSAGLSLSTDPLPQRARRDDSVWLVPGLGVDNRDALMRRLTQLDAREAAQCLGRHHRLGGPVAASCSAVFLLQAAGLLARRTVTTSWWLAGALRALEPTCMVDADKIVCCDGNLVTAGGSMAQGDLMLHLLKTRLSGPLADQVGRVLMTEVRPSQASFALPAMQVNGSELVQRLTRRIEETLPDPPTVSVLALALGISERTLARRVREATGQSPLALIQAVRLHQARLLISGSRVGIDEVARRVGYGDTTALRRLLRKAAGVTPSQFRAGTLVR